MKKIYTFIIALFVGVSAATAAIHTVSVTNFAFTPANVTANVGDTVRWVWASGTHTTTSTSVPSGATAWDANITSNATTFDYVIPVAGTYNYFCSIHPSMTGTITASSGTGIAKNAGSSAFSAYPNPFKDRVTLSHASVDAITVFNMVGEVVSRQSVEATEVKTVLDLSALPSGVYFVNTIKEGVVVGTRRIVKS